MDTVDHVVNNNIDLCVVTETWLKDQDTVSVAALSPPGYSFKSFPRQSERKGGGTGIMFNNTLKVSLSGGGEKKSFEFSEWILCAQSRAITIVAVYCPPYLEAHPVPSSVFFEEFSTYLENTVMCPEILLITGDFNFHLDNTMDGDANKSIDLLETFGLLQHVTLPTHSSGHILDLLISRSSNDINVLSTCVSSFPASDHRKLSFPVPHLSMQEVSFCKLRQINLETFKTDIASTDLYSLTWSNLDDLTNAMMRL